MNKIMKQLLFVSLFLLFLPISVLADTPGMNGYNTVPNPNEKIIPKHSNQGYVPANVQESQSQEAARKKRAQETKEKHERAIQKDSSYESVKQAAERVDQILEKKAPTVKELEQAARDIESIKNYIAKNADKNDSSQIQGLQTTIRNYEEKFVSLEEAAKKREEAQTYLEQAKNTVDPTKLSKLTSYIYLEDGFFGTTDIFPKVVNAIVQGLFFVTKTLYCLVIIILEQVFSANVYQVLDQIVSFSAQMFQTFMDDYQYLVYALAMIGGLVEFFKTKRFPFQMFRFLLVWFLALFLYHPSIFSTNVVNQQFEAKYNLSRVIQIVDSVSSDMTKIAISGFDQLDKEHQSIGTNANNLATVKEAIFQEMVYKPFLALNFNTTDVSEEKVRVLFETEGKTKDVKTFSDKNEKISNLSWSSIGSKFLTAFASLVKAMVVGLALIMIGLISLVFKYMVLLMIVALVFLLFIAMIPSFEQVLGNAGKKILQFAFLGGLGLFGIRAFLFINSLIEGVAGGMSKVYFWVAILQGLIWFVLWRCRSMLMGLFVRGTLSAQEVAQRVQQNLGHLYQPDLIPTVNPFSKNRTLDRSTVEPSQPLADSLVNEALEPSIPSSSGVRTLFRATKNTMKQGANRVLEGYDTLRYGAGETLDKQVALDKRAEFKQRLLDTADHLRHVATIPKGERLRSKLHDLAGDTNSPAQVAFKERENRYLERQERQEERKREQVAFREYQQQSDEKLTLSSMIENELVKPQMKREFHREQLKRKQEIPSIQSKEPLESSPIVEEKSAISRELFEKRKK
ncbi:hypothetical protein VYH90_08935 [Streptococcus anginosus]|uniref:Conjugal transfer protein n=1 Tax=Streptococcus vaginalis TaxID=2748301 RepID=A0ABS3GF65_9STRE|nr:hypothetical protein [Streptococcus vaginalis]MBO0365308.1 hypothetical protein [Streptococcus vaginalis]MED5845650.1 hypothetical protein [Streptococcus anginosus]MED5904002.1 hypothetical protein [Streptococcus anginosus]MED5964557.1 hypothetical protein [Streptococcus anginosus]